MRSGRVRSRAGDRRASACLDLLARPSPTPRARTGHPRAVQLQYSTWHLVLASGAARTDRRRHVPPDLGRGVDRPRSRNLRADQLAIGYSDPDFPRQRTGHWLQPHRAKRRLPRRLAGSARTVPEDSSKSAANAHVESPAVKTANHQANRRYRRLATECRVIFDATAAPSGLLLIRTAKILQQNRGSCPSDYATMANDYLPVRSLRDGGDHLYDTIARHRGCLRAVSWPFRW